ncbi:MAG: WbqC family protein [Balneolaceae bacterium]|nr:WbqC family protein [Balneolaceae bacterium]
MKYSDRDWENRNKIMTQHGPHWLSVPVHQESSDQLILNSHISEHEKKWPKKHKRTIQMNSFGTPCFEEVFPLLEELYDREWERLMDINLYFVDLVCDYLDIDCRFLKASDLEAEGEGEELLLWICREREATESTCPARWDGNYLTPELWEEAGITLTFHDYDYPEYEQGKASSSPGSPSWTC